jgi:hypothetical protein
LKIVVSMLPGWEVINNYSTHILGRIWVYWDPSISSLKALDIHEQVITCQVDSVVACSPWALSVVYGATQRLDRRDLLQRLNFLKFSAGCLPWLIAGDFNVVRTTQEKWGSASLTCYEKEFGDCVFSLKVDDLAYSGFFTLGLISRLVLILSQGNLIGLWLRLIGCNTMVIPLWIFWKEVYLIILLLLFWLQSMLAIGLNLLSFLISGLNMLNS